MTALKSTTRSALVAFSPEAPFLAAGTLAGAFDLLDSSAAKLEIFKLDFQSSDRELTVVGQGVSSEQFNRLSWGNTAGVSEEYPFGLIAGGLCEGNIDIWNPATLINHQDIEGAPVAQLNKQTGNVRGLEFNPNSPNLLASGSGNGEVWIWDLANPTNPTHYPSLKSVNSGPQGEMSFLSWNRKVQHILASTSYSGITLVWDLKRQKPVISFGDSSRKRCSVLQWNPDAATQLIVASDDEYSPSMQVWDVRNTISPVKEFSGHTKGIMGMSWCPSDSTFLLTCSKDSRTLCWDTVSGEIVCELPIGMSWNFDVQWSPRIPGVLSASSFDGKVDIYNIEACSRMASGEAVFGEGSSAALMKAPKWLKRPVGVSFGFGGKLASFRPCEVSQGAVGSSEVYIHSLVTEDNLVLRSTEFEAAIADGEKTSLRDLCEKKSHESSSEEDKETWNFLRVMFEDEGNARTKLLEHLGFKVQATENGVVEETQLDRLDDIVGEMAKDLTLDDNTALETSVRLKSGLDVSFHQDNGEEFFDNLNSPKGDASLSIGGNKTADDDAEVEQETKESAELLDYDEAIQHSLVVGDYKGAVMQCLSAKRMADALIIAHVGGGSLWEKTRDEYLRKTNCSYLKVVSAMVNNDLVGLVNSRPLKSWKETLALICTYSQREDWAILCDALATRLTTVGNRLAATLCYICAGNIEKSVEIWSKSLHSDYDGRSFVDHLQDLMEKTIILALGTGQKRVSPSLSKLVESYAELLASQGLLSTAMEYLKLIGMEESSHGLTILRDRISLSRTDKKEEPLSFPSENREFQAGALYNNQDNFNQSVAGGVVYPDNYGQTGNLAYPGGYVQEQQQTNLYVPPPQYNPSQTPQYNPSQTPQYNPSQTLQYNPSQTLQYNPPQTLQYNTPQTLQYNPPQTPQYNPPQTPQYNQAQAPQVFLPSPVPPQQTNFAPPVNQAQVKPFVPSTPPVLKNVEQYQQPTLGSQLYPGIATAPVGSRNYETGAPPLVSAGATHVQPPVAPNLMVPGLVTAPAAGPRTFMPVPTPAAPQQPGLPPPVQPQSPTQASQVQSLSAPPAPPPTIQSVDTSNVSSELRPVISTLTRLYQETSEVLGGARANPAKRREIDDNSRKIGSLFAKLNSGDISPNAASKLVQLCQALDAGDYATAFQIQVGLTTSDWDECSFWLAALKRMIKNRQNMR